jgi:hypothetical protein
MNTDERGWDFICVYGRLSAVKPTFLLLSERWGFN